MRFCLVLSIACSTQYLDNLDRRRRNISLLTHSHLDNFALPETVNLYCYHPQHFASSFPPYLPDPQLASSSLPLLPVPQRFYRTCTKSSYLAGRKWWSRYCRLNDDIFHRLVKKGRQTDSDTIKSCYKPVMFFIQIREGKLWLTLGRWIGTRTLIIRSSPGPLILSPLTDSPWIE